MTATQLAMPYRSIQHVYFDDLDALNILHNVRFLLFMERARGAMFNDLGFHWEDDFSVNPDKYHVIAEHRIRYLRPVRGEGDVCVEVRPVLLGRSSCSIDARVTSIAAQGPGDVTSFAEGRTRLVRLDPANGRPTPWTERFRAAIGPLVPSDDP